MKVLIPFFAIPTYESFFAKPSRRDFTRARSENSSELLRTTLNLDCEKARHDLDC
jgi:hypothetical protein